MVNESAKTLYQKARQCWEEGDRAAARSLYDAALDADPSFALPHFDLGSLLEKTDPSASRNHYAKFIELAAGDERLAGLMSQAAHKLAAVPESARLQRSRPAVVAPQQRRAAERGKPSRRMGRKLAWVILIWWLIAAVAVLAIIIGNLGS